MEVEVELKEHKFSKTVYLITKKALKQFFVHYVVANTMTSYEHELFYINHFSASLQLTMQYQFYPLLKALH